MSPGISCTVLEKVFIKIAMRPQDIEKIAQGVAGAFSSAGAAPRAGCGAFSNPVEYDCQQSFGCSSNYECGDMGNFSCLTEFTCPEAFFCATYYSGTPIGK